MIQPDKSKTSWERINGDVLTSYVRKSIKLETAMTDNNLRRKDVRYTWWQCRSWTWPYWTFKFKLNFLNPMGLADLQTSYHEYSW